MPRGRVVAKAQRSVLGPWLALLASILGCVLLSSRDGRALGPGSEERKLSVGICLPSGDPCAWDCDLNQTGCPRGGESCAYDVRAVATGELTLHIDESNCPGDGAEYRISLLVRRGDGSSFTTSEAHIDACHLNVSCSQTGQQPKLPFFCTTEGTRARESTPPADKWLDFHPLPEGLAAQVSSGLNTGGTPVIAQATGCGFEDHSQDDAPTVKRYCVKLYVLNAPPYRTPTPCAQQ